MSTKQLLPNQHTPLHFIYGHDDCCLCKAEEKTSRLKYANRRLLATLAKFCIIEPSKKDRKKFEKLLEEARGVLWECGGVILDAHGIGQTVTIEEVK